MDFYITLAILLAVGFSAFGLIYSIRNWNNANE